MHSPFATTTCDVPLLPFMMIDDRVLSGFGEEREEEGGNAWCLTRCDPMSPPPPVNLLVWSPAPGTVYDSPQMPPRRPPTDPPACPAPKRQRRMTDATTSSGRAATSQTVLTALSILKDDTQTQAGERTTTTTTTKTVSLTTPSPPPSPSTLPAQAPPDVPVPAFSELYPVVKRVGETVVMCEKLIREKEGLARVIEGLTRENKMLRGKLDVVFDLFEKTRLALPSK
jgi:hypothetical protein